MPWDMAEGGEEATNREDGLLMAEVAAGNTHALGTLYLRYGRLVVSVVSRHVGPRVDDVDDLVQDVFLSVRDASKRYREAGQFRGWLVGVAVRVAKAHRRRSWVRNTLFGLFRAAEAGDQVSEPHMAFEARQEVESALAELDGVQKEVVLLSLVEGLSAKDIAAALGIEEKTVWTRLHRARTRLKARRQQP